MELEQKLEAIQFEEEGLRKVLAQLKEFNE
jgi:hypothetical protein